MSVESLTERRLGFIPTVICRGHGLKDEYDGCGPVFLTEKEYERQMMACDSGWKCPQCHASADWDDDCL